MTWTLRTYEGRHQISDEDAKRIQKIQAMPKEPGFIRATQIKTSAGQEIRVFPDECELSEE